MSPSVCGSKKKKKKVLRILNREDTNLLKRTACGLPQRRTRRLSARSSARPPTTPSRCTGSRRTSSASAPTSSSTPSSPARPTSSVSRRSLSKPPCSDGCCWVQLKAKGQSIAVPGVLSSCPRGRAAHSRQGTSGSTHPTGHTSGRAHLGAHSWEHTAGSCAGVLPKYQPGRS